jgi:hypothetical protein
MKKTGMILIGVVAGLSIGLLAWNVVPVRAEGEVTTSTTTPWSPRGGMMGNGGMMGGYRTDTEIDADEVYGPMGYGMGNGTCLVLDPHLSDVDRAFVDAKEVQLLSAIDLVPMTEAEQILALHDVKAQLVIFIQESGFTFTYYRP